MTEGVGKKIVDALKKQTDVEIMPQTRNEEYSQPENRLWNKKYGKRAGYDQRTGHSGY